MAAPGPPLHESEFRDAVELALLLADRDARWGDYRRGAQRGGRRRGVQGSLQAEYEAKHRQWSTSGPPRSTPVTPRSPDGPGGQRPALPAGGWPVFY